MNPKRSEEPRRQEDAVIRQLASETLDNWLAQVSRKMLIWFVVSVAGTVATVSWAASAWATNYARDVEQVTKRVDSLELVQRAQLDAMRDLTRALDSLRITLRANESPHNPLVNR